MAWHDALPGSCRSTATSRPIGVGCGCPHRLPGVHLRGGLALSCQVRSVPLICGFTRTNVPAAL